MVGLTHGHKLSSCLGTPILGMPQAIRDLFFPFPITSNEEGAVYEESSLELDFGNFSYQGQKAKRRSVFTWGS